LFEGDLLTQLQLTFGDEPAEIVLSQIESPPTQLMEPMFLAIVISGRELHRHTTDRSSVKALIRSLLNAA
jgi:hypothetical protein